MAFGTINLYKIFTWVDASYVVHHDMKIQTGSDMSMGLDVTHYIPIKKKLNTNISTESELVDMSDYVPYNIW